MNKFERPFEKIMRVNSYLFVFTSLFLVQYFTIGQLSSFNKIIVFGRFYIHEILFVTTSLIITVLFVKAEWKSNWS